MARKKLDATPPEAVLPDAPLEESQPTALIDDAADEAGEDEEGAEPELDAIDEAVSAKNQIDPDEGMERLMVATEKNPKLHIIRTDLEAHEYCTKILKDAEEALIWKGCLKTCPYWHLSVGAVGFGRYEMKDETEPDEQDEVKVRVKGVIEPHTGAEIRKFLEQVPTHVLRWTGRGDKKKELANHLVTTRTDYRRNTADEQLSPTIWFQLVPVKFDRRLWGPKAIESLGFNRGKWPVALRTGMEKAASIKLAI